MLDVMMDLKEMWNPSNVISAHQPASPRRMLEGNTEN